MANDDSPSVASACGVSGTRSTDRFRFGRFELQPTERRLWEANRAIALEPRAFDLLVALVERGGRLATKDELFESIWPGRIVEDGNLHVQVSALRKVLGADAIATVLGRGYRFTTPVEQLGRDVGRPSEPRHNLPQQLASFVGRDDDLRVLSQVWERTRLVTLAGMGGSGKTRLAIKLAERTLASFPDGVRFVDLAPVARPDRVAWAVAIAVGVREHADKSMEDALVQQLAGRRMLLLLDNCEHLVEACAALLGRLLSSTPSLCVLITSRERLGIAGEHVVAVRPLTLPPPATEQDLDVVAGFEAIQLFVERARQAMPGFELSTGNLAASVEICRRLDGIPLALELAAARVALLSVEQIRASLDDRFRLLTGGSRIVSRHQTLWASLQSSYEALANDERECFRRLSVFEGGWTLDAASAIAVPGDRIQTMLLLGHLADKSLIQVDCTAPDGPRFSMLETVRQFAHELLAASPSGAESRDRHLAYFLDFAKSAQAKLAGEAMRVWLTRLDAEVPNLLAAHAWCDQVPGGADKGLELATNLRTYWLARGLFAFGLRVYEEALAREGSDQRGMQRARTLYALGQHHYVRGQLRQALAPIEEALSIARDHGDDELAVYCLDRLSLAFAWLGEMDRAHDCCQEEMAIAERTGDPRLVGFALTAKGGISRARGDFDAAAQAYEAALALFDEKMDWNNRHNALVDIARASIACGKLDRARETLVAAIRLVGEMGAMYRGHFSLDATSRLAAASGDCLLAARLQGASDAAVDRMGGTRTWFDDPILASLHEKPATVLGAEEFADAYGSGRELALEAALAEAAGWLDAAVLEEK